jgi:RimJ/RimL family protein N-acetyltransferase
MRIYRKLHPFEQWRLRDHLQRLVPEDRRRRFFAGVSDHTIAEHCRRIDWLGAIVVGCFEDGILRGAAELRFETGRVPLAGELALSVETEWQNQGVGTELVRRALLAAGNRGLAALQMVCLAENQRVQRIARRHAIRLVASGGEAEAALAVPRPTQFSLVEEAVAEGIGLFADCWSAFARAA